MTKQRSRAETDASIRNPGRILTIGDRREKDQGAGALRRPLSRKSAESQRSAFIVWDEV